MNEGDAASWKEQLLEEASALPMFDLGTWKNFKKDLIEAFEPYDAPGDALDEIKALRMGNDSIEEHIAKFKMLRTKSGLDETSPAVIDYFRETLNIPLQRKLLTMENPPKTLKDWYTWASKLDNNFRKMQRIMGRTRQGKTDSGKKKEETSRRWNFTRKDPNAMDVDAITTEERDEMMKKGLCFRCKEPGHISKDCPTKGQSTSKGTKPPSYASTWKPTTTTQKKMSGKELLTHIRALTAEMDEGEKEKFYDEAEKEGF